MHLDSSDIDRFWAKVDKNGPVPAAQPGLGPCWLWTATKSWFGHGKFTVAKRTAGRVIKLPSHRVAYELCAGSIPPGLNVLHKCDVAPCVKPAHLYLGGQSENTLDAYRRGRAVPIRGALHKNTKFTEADVIEIRTEYAAGNMSQAALALYFGVGQPTIHRIVTRQRWAHLP